MHGHATRPTPERDRSAPASPSAPGRRASPGASPQRAGVAFAVATRTPAAIARVAGARVQRSCSCGGAAESKAECAECAAAGRDVLQRAATPAAPAHARAQAPPIVHEVLRSPGRPLDAGPRRDMERHLGSDLGHVRIHTDDRAAASARAIHAAAYTVGASIVFDRSKYAPHAAAGRRLLAHELVHTVQQGGASTPSGPALPIESPGSAAEDEARRLADAVDRPPREAARPAAGTTPRVAASPASPEPFAAVAPRVATSPAVQRQPTMPMPWPEVIPRVGPMPRVGPIPEVGPAPFVGPQVEPDIDFDIEELPEVSEEPSFEETPSVEEPPGDPEPAPDPEPEPAPEPAPKPVPPIGPAPDPDEDKDKCGSPQLPLTVVTHAAGPQGQGGTVIAAPLTRCPGNTVGSLADERVYKATFDCIRKAGQRRTFHPLHILHGLTRRSGARNLHGPGNLPWNVIIGSASLNKTMSANAEQPAVRRVYGLNQALWYESRVDNYVPGNEHFAESITVDFGQWDVATGTRGPRIGGGTFVETKVAPSCPPSAPVAGLPPVTVLPPAPDFLSTLDICHRVLRSRDFPVTDGGVKVTVRADWVNQSGTPRPCPNAGYRITLVYNGMLVDDEVSTTPVAAGTSVSLTWRKLPAGTYHLVISVNDHDPSCCLMGDIGVRTFSAPRPRPGEPLMA